MFSWDVNFEWQPAFTHDSRFTSHDKRIFCFFTAMKQALIKLHIAVFLAGFTGVLGKLIHLNEGLLVWYRIMLTVVTLFLWLSWKKKIARISAASVWKLLGIGTLIALHWVCFFGSIKMANVSIGLICFASVGLFTAILEPLMMRNRFSWAEIGLGLISLLGIYLIFHFDTRYRAGILVGILSALLAAVFSVLNKKNVHIAELIETDLKSLRRPAIECDQGLVVGPIGRKNRVRGMERRLLPGLFMLKFTHPQPIDRIRSPIASQMPQMNFNDWQLVRTRLCLWEWSTEKHRWAFMLKIIARG